MARTPKNDAAAIELGRILTTLSDEQERPVKPKQIELWIAHTFSIHYSDETIRRAHKGEVDPTACDPGLLVALAAFYGVQPDDLGDAASRRISSLLAMAQATSDPNFTPPDRDFAASRCIRARQGTLDELLADSGEHAIAA